MESKSHECDVFVNHRGPDVKKTFVAHLDAALRRDGFRPFLDAKDIGQGRHVFNTIDKALKDACVHVAIFSRGYAESKYCLDELCSMLSSGKDILPVFYHVKPEDLRRIENGPFKAGFEKHMARNRENVIPKWKAALAKVADIRGFRLDEVNGNEEQLIRSILVEVRRLMPIDVLPGIQRYGTAESMTDVLKLLENTNVVGLVGMGGIGKTTLAEEVFNHCVMNRQFERYCFLKDVRSRSSEPLQLQQEFLRELGHQSELQSRSAQEYARAFNGVMRERVLIIIDDIDHYDQFATIVPDIRRLGSSSRVVITSRQRDVLVQTMASAASHGVYEVPLLDKIYSRHLFNRHAFLSETPSEGFVDLAGQVADACGGHALLLKTIGASLFDKRQAEDKGIWQETMKALEENEEVFDKLRSTYDSLPAEGDRAMFREIACMLIGMEQDVALRIWKSCNSGEHYCTTSRNPELALRRLVDRSLVRVERGRFLMHDVLRDMGRDIVKKEGRKPEEWSYLWDASVAKKVLSYKKMNTTIRGMVLGSRKNGGVSCAMSQLTSMEELHFLVLNNCDVMVLDGSWSWPQELRWLEWSGCCFSKLPSHLNLPSLVVLDLSYSFELTRLWSDDDSIQLPLLETLDLSWCTRLEELGENVGQSVPKLKNLKMKHCRNLRRLPASIGDLVDLELLDLEFCKELVNLPEEMKGLISLKDLKLSWCGKLQQLPIELGKLTNLMTLEILKCRMLCELPASIGGLKMLEILDMSDSGVTNLPVGFGLLTSLTTLRLPSIVQGSLKGLEALTSLSLSCGSIDMSNLGAFSVLKVLKLWRHVAMTILPRSVGNLKWLVDLKVSECLVLSTIEALPIGLEHLDICCCPKLTTIPSLAPLTSLVHLECGGNSSLRHIYGLVCLTTLKYINIAGCTSLEGRGIRIIESRALRECLLSGSNVGVAYNNRWLERNPSTQMISYYGDRVPVFSNGIASPVVWGNEWSKVLEASISSKAECVALIWCIVIKGNSKYGYFWTKVEVWRSGRLVREDILLDDDEEYELFLVYECNRNQVYMYTMRREHCIMQSLKHGDQIYIYVEFIEGDPSSVVEGGICTVHKEDENLVMVMNSEVLSRNQSEQLVSQFAQLVLEDEMNLELELWSGSLPNHVPQNGQKTQLVLENDHEQLEIPEMNVELVAENGDQQLEILEVNFELQLWSRSPRSHGPQKRQKTQIVDDQELGILEIDLDLKL